MHILLCTLLGQCKSAIAQLQGNKAVSHWQRLGPGGGGATFIPTFSFHTPGDFFLRCDMTGTYQSKNGGNTYQQINFDNGASCFAYDPLDSNTVYAGSAVLHRSKDGGKTWTRLFPQQKDITGEILKGDHAEYKLQTAAGALYGAGVGEINSILADPVKKGTIYFTMGQFFFYSADGGATWKREALPARIVSMYSNGSNVKNKVFLFSADAVYVFNKKSRAIAKQAIPGGMQPAFSFTAGVKKHTNQLVLYALHHDTHKEIDGAFGYTEVWRSTNNGTSWQPLNDPVVTNSGNFAKPSFSMIVCAAFDADNAYVVSNRYIEKKTAAGDAYWYGALKTGDAGNHWQWVWKGGGGSGQYGIKDGKDAANLKDAWVSNAFGGEYIRLMDAGVYPQDGNIAIVTDWYRTMKTMDGGNTWNSIYSLPKHGNAFSSNGMDVTTCYGVHFDPFDSLHISISYTDIGYHHSFDGGKSWQRAIQGVPAEWVNTCYWVAFDPAVKNKLWSAWSGLHDFPRGKMTRNPAWKEGSLAKGGICVSTDGGISWRPSVEGMGLNAPATCIVLDTASAPGNRTLYAAVYNKGVFKSVDDGKTWQLKNTGIGKNTCAFELTLANNGNLYLTVSPTPVHANGKTGIAFYPGAVYRSVDGAESWTKLAPGKGLLFPNGIASDPVNPNRIYLACWGPITLGDLVGREAVRAAGKDSLLAMRGGIFLSEDAGNSWRSIFDQRQYVYDVTADPVHPGRLYCNTFNSAAYRSDDYGATWKKIKGYDFHWGHRVIPDRWHPGNVYITSYGSSVWYGQPETE